MKKHKFWAWAAVICMLMAILTGHGRYIMKLGIGI